VVRPPAGRSGTDETLQARARAWAERCCADQGLPFEIDDRQTLARIAELLGLPAQSRKTAVKRDSSRAAVSPHGSISPPNGEQCEHLLTGLGFARSGRLNCWLVEGPESLRGLCFL